MTLEVLLDGSSCKCSVSEDAVVLLRENYEPGGDGGQGSGVDAADHSVSFAFDDIIALQSEDGQSADTSGQSDQRPAELSTVIHYMKKVEDDPKWTVATSRISPHSGKEEDYKAVIDQIQPLFDKAVGTRPKKLVVLMNPIGGKRQARKMYDTVMTPLFALAKITCDLKVSERPKHLIEVITAYDTSSVDGIVMMGGDGTFTEIINVIIQKTQQEAGIDYNDMSAKLKVFPTPLTIIPTGTGNGVAEGLTGCQDVMTATLHVIRGKVRPIRILSTHNEGRLLGYSGCIVGLGLAADMVYIADDKLRWMKAARYLALPFVYLFRRIRRFDAEITVTTRKKVTNGDGTEEYVYEEEKINDNISMIMTWPFSLVDDDGNFTLSMSCMSRNHNTHKGDMFLTIYKPMSKLDLIKHFRDLIGRKNSAFKRDFIRVINAQSFRIKVTEKPGQECAYNRMVSIDGEMQHCTNPEYHVRILEDVLNVYSSCELV